MNKMISMLVLMVLVLPLTVGILLNGPNNLLTASSQFFSGLLENVNRFGTS